MQTAFNLEADLGDRQAARAKGYLKIAHRAARGVSPGTFFAITPGLHALQDMMFEGRSIAERARERVKAFGVYNGILDRMAEEVRIEDEIRTGLASMAEAG